VCRGGHPASRYDDADRSFDHRSAHCEAMFPISERVVDFLVAKGLGEHLVDDDLRTDLTTRSAPAPAPRPRRRGRLRTPLPVIGHDTVPSGHRNGG